ncbi:hypothetical protein WR25_23096 [Diploscapter pachys]|uniref:ShKT domain-containing protein n=1 Tax=Diploscapter pachys TaxID=2018661 RepID=A0A2A2LKN0_9BILA|nr:hypothetical protein WR25_23096 [Diploscapter pachys]
MDVPHSATSDYRSPDNSSANDDDDNAHDNDNENDDDNEEADNDNDSDTHDNAIIYHVNADQPPCIDEDPNCQYWAKNGFCQNDHYTTEEKQKLCAKTCNLCPTNPPPGASTVSAIGLYCNKDTGSQYCCPNPSDCPFGTDLGACGANDTCSVSLNGNAITLLRQIKRVYFDFMYTEMKAIISIPVFMDTVVQTPHRLTAKRLKQLRSTAARLVVARIHVKDEKMMARVLMETANPDSNVFKERVAQIVDNTVLIKIIYLFIQYIE